MVTRNLAASVVLELITLPQFQEEVCSILANQFPIESSSSIENVSGTEMVGGDGLDILVLSSNGIQN
jgi:hypothetical protein